VHSAVFIDCDGVINEHWPDYVKSGAEFRFLSGALSSLRQLARSPLAIAVISNQPAINSGLLSLREANHIHQRILDEIESAGGRVDGIYVCTHRRNEESKSWRPISGLLYQAAYDLDIDLAYSYFVGDTLSDVRVALAAGCTPILVLTDRACAELEKGFSFYPKGFFVASDLEGGVDSILEWSDIHQPANASRTSSQSGRTRHQPSMIWIGAHRMP
jgi:D-glycero-D-manno-heptose 1,7-bisphosphate phosphatase